MFYHCSPTAGLQILEPRIPAQFDKPQRVYLTTSLPMALLYGIRHFEYTYGYTKAGQIYFEEYFPNALALLYSGKSASLYLCSPVTTEATSIPNEQVSPEPVVVLEEHPIPDLLAALLDQERTGTLIIRRYDQMTERDLAWIRDAEADVIRKRKLTRDPDSPMARFMRTHYPESWAMVLSE